MYVIKHHLSAEEWEHLGRRLRHHLQAIAKRVDTLPVIGYMLDTHHCIAYLAPPLLLLINVVRNSQWPSTKPASTSTKFVMTFNQASLNIEMGTGLEEYYIVPWLFIHVVCYLQEVGKMLRVYPPFCNCL